jgi:SAM-dependent methyltransferase
MTNEEALKKAGGDWDFESKLCHLNTITKYIPKDAEIFDAGSGRGVLTLALKLLGYHVSGGDKKIYPDAVFPVQKFDILKDEPEKQYDAVISIATLEHQTNPALFLKKLLAMVKDNGYIYLATPNVTHLLNRARFFFGEPPLGNLKELMSEENFTGHVREYSMKELKQMCEWSGIKIILAKNRQETKPNFNFRNFRGVYVNFFRLLSYLIPGARESNIILGRKLC